MKKRSKSEYSQICDNTWNNKFNADNYSFINKKLNSKFIDYFYNVKDFHYKQKPRALINTLSSKKVQVYQSEMLRNYLTEPGKYLIPDCDHLSFFVDCNKSKTVEAIQAKSGGFEHFRTKALASILSINYSKHVGEVNKGLINGEYQYTGVYTIHLFSDNRKFFKLYIANNENKSIRLDFIPSRFSDIELNIFFGHLCSVLSRSSYKQLAAKARYRRVDIAFNMPGVFQPAVFFHHQLHSQLSSGECWPPKMLAETTYLGNKDTSDHYIVYDKILKEASSHCKNNVLAMDERKSLIGQLAAVTRVERRHFVKRAKKPAVALDRLPNIVTRLDKLFFFDPIFLCELSKENLKALLNDKSENYTKPTKNFFALNQLYKKYGNECVIQLNDKEYEPLQREMLGKLLNIIVKPKQVEANALRRIVQDHNFDHGQQVNELPIKSYTRECMAYLSMSTHTFVEAGAGTGKTSQIVKRIEEITLNRNVQGSQITVLAYTNQAVNEMESRISHLNDNEITISTFTAWCGSVLKRFKSKEYADYRYSYQDGGSVNNSNTINILDNIISGCGYSVESEVVLKALTLSINKKIKVSTAISKATSDVHCDEIKNVIKKYHRYKTEHKIWDFEDVLFQFNKALKDRKFARRVTKRNKHILMDEMQDANKLQWSILERLANAGSHLFVVGDTTQAIFRFRGADPDLIHSVKTRLDDTRTYHAKTNYRSSASLLALTNVARRLAAPNSKLLYTNNAEVGDKPILLNAGDQKDLLIKFKSAIRLLNQKGFSNNSILVISRTNKLSDIFGNCSELNRNEVMPKLSTMHKAKGIESDACIVIDPRFHNRPIDTQQDYLNLMYVALTRAKQCLIIIRKSGASSLYKYGNADDINVLDILANIEHLFLDES